MDSYYKEFTERDRAVSWMKGKNRAARKIGNTRDLFVVVSGPSDNFIVVDIDTAIELESHYEWAA